MIPESCAVILPTFNEAARIDAALSYYKAFSRIIYIVDNYSTDKTLDLARNYPVKILQYRNNGSTESPAWFQWLLQAVPSEFYLFLSCSERITTDALASIPSLIHSRVDLCYWPRISLTGNSESLIYGPIFSFFGWQKYDDFTCRLASSKALRDNLDDIHIHDNFRSFREKTKFVEIARKSHLIQHLRPVTNAQVLQKLLNYAIVDARQSIASQARSSQPVIYLLRVIRELLVLVILLLSFRLSSIRANELLARIVLHLQTYILIVNAGYDS